jgi:peptidoglycan hydrolase FlgJ
MDVSQSLTAVSAADHGAALAAARDAQLDPKLVSAAHQFEASLMAVLLKPLNSGPTFGDEEESGSGATAGGGLEDLTSSADGSGGALMSFGSEALAKALSEKGGLGIGRRILDHFDAVETATRAASGDEPAGKAAGSEIRYGIGNHY